MNSRISSRNYQFKDCHCQDYVGRDIAIPDGIWPVAELDRVTVQVGNTIYDLSAATFQLLKLERKVIAVG